MVKELYELMPMIFGRYDEVEMLPAMKENGIVYIIYGAGKGGRFLMDWIKHIFKSGKLSHYTDRSNETAWIDR